MFETEISDHYDARVGTLSSIKRRSFGADVVTLAALTVLAYAQMEGGIKDLASCTIRHLNARKMHFGEIRPSLLQWRNTRELERFRSAVNFTMVAEASPFASLLSKRARIRGINRRFDMNQMSWSTIRTVYSGFGLDYADVEVRASEIDDLVTARNDVAHHGVPPNFASSVLENQLRNNVALVEDVLVDLAIKLLPYFSTKMHLRN